MSKSGAAVQICTAAVEIELGAPVGTGHDLEVALQGTSMIGLRVA